MMNILMTALICHLSDDLRRPPWRGHAHPLAGHCYVACEALYHRAGGRAAGLTPCQVQHEGVSHWYLRHTSGTIIDPTADQFASPPPYEQGRGRGFLTSQPSRRAALLLARLDTEVTPCSTFD